MVEIISKKYLARGIRKFQSVCVFSSYTYAFKAISKKMVGNVDDLYAKLFIAQILDTSKILRGYKNEYYF